MICLTCRFCFNTSVQILKFGHNNESASRTSLFVAYVIIYYLQFVALELPIQVSQYVEKYDWQCMHPKSQPEEQICLSIVRPPLYMNLLALYPHSCTSIVEIRGKIIHTSSRLHCSCQMTHLEVLVLKQLHS